ncbi:hypothetical protein RJ035_001750 [Blastomyces gilchristii]
MPARQLLASRRAEPRVVGDGHRLQRATFSARRWPAIRVCHARFGTRGPQRGTEDWISCRRQVRDMGLFWRLIGWRFGCRVATAIRARVALHGGRLGQGFYGLAKTYQNLTACMDENVLPDKRAEFFKHATNCQIQGIDGAFHDIFSYFIDGERPIYEPVPASVLDWSGQMGRRGMPTMPLFMYKAFGDEISPVEDTDKLVHKYCSNRATFEYYRNLIGGHVTEAIIGSVNALEWVSDHLAGRPVRNLGSCRTENVLITKI